MIACTNIQNFEEGENCASTILVDQTLRYEMNFIGYDMILFRYDLILPGSIFQVHELSILLVVGFINFGVTNQVPQVSFKIVVGDLISLHSFGFDIFYNMIIFGSGLKIQYLTVFLVTSFINFGVTNQAPQVSFNFAAEDSMLVFSYEIVDIIFFESLMIFEAISYYGSQ